MLEIKYNTRSYNKIIVPDIDYKSDKKITLLVGQNGIGKSTFCKMLRLDFSEKGINNVYYYGYNFTLLDNISVIDNLLIYGERDTCFSLCKEINLINAIDTKVKDLSGGQRQRLVLVIAILIGGEIVILDEILANLDKKNIQRTLDLLEKVNNINHVIIITHNKNLLHLYNSINFKTGEVLIAHGSKVNFEVHQNEVKPKNYKRKLIYNNLVQLLGNAFIAISLVFVFGVMLNTLFMNYNSDLLYYTNGLPKGYIAVVCGEKNKEKCEQLNENEQYYINVESMGKKEVSYNNSLFMMETLQIPAMYSEELKLGNGDIEILYGNYPVDNTNQILVPSNIATENNIGQEITLIQEDGSKNSYVISGIYQSYDLKNNVILSSYNELKYGDTLILHVENEEKVVNSLLEEFSVDDIQSSYISEEYTHKSNIQKLQLKYTFKAIVIVIVIIFVITLSKIKIIKNIVLRNKDFLSYSGTKVIMYAIMLSSLVSLFITLIFPSTLILIITILFIDFYLYKYFYKKKIISELSWLHISE